VFFGVTPFSTLFNCVETLAFLFLRFSAGFERFLPRLGFFPCRTPPTFFQPLLHIFSSLTPSLDSGLFSTNLLDFPVPVYFLAPAFLTFPRAPVLHLFRPNGEPTIPLSFPPQPLPPRLPDSSFFFFLFIESLFLCFSLHETSPSFRAFIPSAPSFEAFPPLSRFLKLEFPRATSRPRPGWPDYPFPPTPPVFPRLCLYPSLLPG